MSPREVTPDDRLHDAEEALKRHSASLSAVTMEQGNTKEALSDHNRRLVAQNEAIVQIRVDVSAIQAARAQRQLEEAVREAKDAAHREALELRLKGIEDSVRSIFSLGRWFAGTVGAALLLAIIAFIVKGGLNVVH